MEGIVMVLPDKDPVVLRLKTYKMSKEILAREVSELDDNVKAMAALLKHFEKQVTSWSSENILLQGARGYWLERTDWKRPRWQGAYGCWWTVSLTFSSGWRYGSTGKSRNGSCKRYVNRYFSTDLVHTLSGRSEQNFLIDTAAGGGERGIPLHLFWR